MNHQREELLSVFNKVDALTQKLKKRDELLNKIIINLRVMAEGATRMSGPNYDEGTKFRELVNEIEKGMNQ